MRTYFLILILFLLKGCIPSSYFLEINPSIATNEKWIPLNESIKDKRIIALGESLHGVKEYNTTKIELIQYLHEKEGFNVLAIESDVAKKLI